VQPQTSPASRRGGKDGGCSVGTGRRRHQDEAAKDEEGDATPDLLLKYLNATLATYVRGQMKHLKDVSEILAKTPENHCKNILNIQIKHLKHMCETYVTSK
jgi:hypothetical protein